MRLAFFADIHARGKDLPVFRAQWDAAVDMAAEERCEAVYVAGDVFDKSNIYDSQATAGEIIQAVKEPMIYHDDMDFFMLAGDHDFPGAGRVSALQALAGIPHVTIIETPEEFFRYGSGKHNQIVCIPWDWALDMAATEELIADYCAYDGDTILVAHLEVVGMKLSQFQTKDTPSARGCCVRREFLESLNLKYMALGNYHIRQEIAPGKGGFIGALRQMNYGDEGNPQGFEIYDTDSGESTWVEVDAAPRYRTVVLMPGEDIPAPDHNEKLRIRTDGWKLSRADAETVENMGGKVEELYEPAERIDRGINIPAGVIDSPRQLVELYNGQQASPLSQDEVDAVCALLEEVEA